MNIIGDILRFIGERPAEVAAISLIIFFSSWKAANVLQGFRIFIFLVLFGAVLATVPASVVFLVTNGDITVLNPGQVGGWADRIAVGCDFLIPCFLIVVPSLLHQRLPWRQSLTDVQALLPTWLAISAAAATVGLVTALHFVKGGQLASMRPTIVIAAIVGVVFLIVPLYSALAEACWQCGYRRVFSDWWMRQRAAWSFVWHTVRQHGTAAGSGEPDEADYLGNLLAALMLRHLDPDQPIPLPVLARLREVTQLDAATGTRPDEPPAAPLDKLLTELDDKVQVKAPAANAGGNGVVRERH